MMMIYIANMLLNQPNQILQQEKKKKEQKIKLKKKRKVNQKPLQKQWNILLLIMNFEKFELKYMITLKKSYFFLVKQQFYLDGLLLI